MAKPRTCNTDVYSVCYIIQSVVLSSSLNVFKRVLSEHLGDKLYDYVNKMQCLEFFNITACLKHFHTVNVTIFSIY